MFIFILILLKVNEVQLLKCQSVTGSFSLYHKYEHSHILKHPMSSQMQLMEASLIIIRMHCRMCSFS